MPPCLLPLRQLNRLDEHGTFGDRKPPNVPLPITIRATENVRNRTPSYAPPCLMPLQQPNRLDGHGKFGDRKPPNAPVPNAITATEPFGWTWDVRRQKAAQCSFTYYHYGNRKRSKQNAVPCPRA
ncbi:hypothetical protein AVEN_102613-1 [Araneus ventricosus]|uniref:Uncharacterized protein n=1 Tax=Araneus ventricosus TaxID=182803 RepID=A0A4Y2BLF7_ARAVE|nr:hypothetical protein AVEN_102613-1 [Araneus ventricosus]